MIKESPIIYFYRKKIYFTFQRSRMYWINEFKDFTVWTELDEQAFFIGFDKDLFKGIEDISYGENDVISFTFFGIIVGLLWSWRSDPV
jgi:hypothetical protein